MGTTGRSSRWLHGLVVGALALALLLVPTVGSAQAADPIATAGPAVGPPAVDAPVADAPPVEAAAAEAAPEPPLAAAAEPFAVAVDPPATFAPGDTIEAHVSGGIDLGGVAVAQCDPTGDICGSADYLTLGETGSGTLSITARRRIGNATRIVDCGVEPCVVTAYLYTTTLQASASVPIEIDPDAPVPHPSLTVTNPSPLERYGPAHVEGHGFEADSYLTLIECGWDPGVAIIPCAPVGTYGVTDATGSLDVSMPVSRSFYGFDCAARPGRCQVWAFSYGVVDLIWAAPLTFDGSTPLVPPTVTITPDSNLVHGQSVSVAGSGFRPSSSAQLVQCQAFAEVGGRPCASTTYYVPVNGSGSFSLTTNVSRLVAGQDCVVVGCVLRVAGSGGDLVDAVLSFDASVPPPPPPSATVEPDADLADRQVVTVTVTDVDPGASVSAATCTVAERRCAGSGQVGWTDEGGTVTGPIAVRRLIGSDDCAVVACEVQVAVYGNEWHELHVPITFDPESPLAPPPTIRVVPATGLWDRQRIDVRGEGFDPSAYVSMQQCAGAVGPASCVSAGYVSTDSTGVLDTTAGVRRTLSLPGGDQDCTVVACVLAVQVNGQAPLVIPISFDPAGPLVGDDLPPQPECVSWPTAGWPTGPIPDGVDAAAVAALGQQMVTNQGDSVVVIHGGQLVYENYKAGLSASTVFPSMSVSKSFTSTMVGMLVDDGVLDIDHDHLFPEWSDAGDPRAAITTRDLLHMSSGLQWTENYGDPTSDVIKLVQSDDGAAYVLAKPLVSTPGSNWSYSTGDTMLLSKVIADTAGVSGPTYDALLHQRILDPLGIAPVSVGFDAVGNWRAGWWTNTTTRNFAKLGLLYLRHGVWEDQQLLSEDWVDFVRTPTSSYSGYGGQFWLNSDGSFEMVGYGGQNVLIVPALDLIVAVNNGGNAAGMADLFRNAEPTTCGGAGPSVVDDAATADAGSSTLIDVLANDSGGPVGLAASTLTVSNPAAAGTATVEGAAIRYQPADGFTGDDTFDYVVCTADRRSCLEATVTVTVSGPPMGSGRQGPTAPAPAATTNGVVPRRP